MGSLSRRPGCGNVRIHLGLALKRGLRQATPSAATASNDGSNTHYMRAALFCYELFRTYIGRKNRPPQSPTFRKIVLFERDIDDVAKS